MTGKEHKLFGIKAKNPLGYLAALGTVVVLNPLVESLKMGWERYRSSKIPIIKTKKAMKKTKISEIISEELESGVNEKRFDPPLEKKAKLSHITAEFFRKACRQELEEKAEETFAAYGIDISSENDEEFDRTEFDFLQPGKQGFLKTARNLSGEVSPEKIERSLFQEWDYEDDGDGSTRTRWGPRSTVRTRGAYIGPNPKDRNKRTMHGANRLAIEALRLYPVVPRGDEAQTTGFLEINGDKYFQYPVWRNPLGLKALKSLLRNREIYRESPNLDRLSKAGVDQILRVRRTEIPSGNFLYFGFDWAQVA